jgi:hypothetical protein
LFRGVASRDFACLDDFVLIVRFDVPWIAEPRLAAANRKKSPNFPASSWFSITTICEINGTPIPPPEFKIFFSEATANSLAQGLEFYSLCCAEILSVPVSRPFD